MWNEPTSEIGWLNVQDKYTDKHMADLAKSIMQNKEKIIQSDEDLTALISEVGLEFYQYLLQPEKFLEAHRKENVIHYLPDGHTRTAVSKINVTDKIIVPNSSDMSCGYDSLYYWYPDMSNIE